MAKDIRSTRIDQGDAIADPDYIFEGQALPSNTTIDSSEFYLGNVMGGVELKGKVVTAGTLPAGGLTINVKSSAEKGGTKDTLEASFVVSAGAIVTGQELFKYIPPRETKNVYFEVELVTTADASAMTADVYPVIVS